MEEGTSRCGCGDGNGIGLVVGTIVGAFQRVNGDVGTRCTCNADHRAEFLADVEHGCVVAFSFANGDSTVKRHVVKVRRIASTAASSSCVFVTFSAPCRTGDGGLVHGLKEMMCEVGGEAHERLDTAGRHQYNGSVPLEFLQPLRSR